MSEYQKKAVVFMCGPSSKTCKCQCPDDPCEHIWDGPTADLINYDKEGKPYVAGWTTTCSKCGMWSINHDIWIAP